MVNKVTKALFRKYRTVDDFADADLPTLQRQIRPTGFYRNKAKAIVAAARHVRRHHDGKVPRTMAELDAIPGVARKTANVVLSNGFGTNVGVVVDTHVKRLSRRLRFTLHEDPVKIERDLQRLFPRERWLQVSDLLIHHGRRTCSAQRPTCHDCAIEDLCPSSQVAGRTDKAPSTPRTSRR
jgi:endonuclease-3